MEPGFRRKAIRWRFYPGQGGRPAGGQLAMTDSPGAAVRFDRGRNARRLVLPDGVRRLLG
jgi:uncharacterized protein YhaN